MKKILSSALSLVLVLFGISPATADASNGLACDSLWQFAHPGACVLSSVKGSLTAPNAQTCDDGYGYKGYDYLSYVSLSNTPNDGQLTRGQDLPFTLRLRQQCISWNGAYDVSVSLVSSTGTTFLSNIESSTFEYDKKYSAPLLSYCSTEICGSGIIKGNIPFPAFAPPGKYSLNVKITSNTAFSKANLNFAMAASLEVPFNVDQIPTLDRMEFVASSQDSVLTCFVLDYTPEAVSAFSITGTNFVITEDGKEIDSIKNLPLASSDRLVVRKSKHGTFATVFAESANARLYSYVLHNQLKGSTYTCSIGIQSSYGAGKMLTKTEVSTVFTSGTSVVDSAPKPSPTPTATPKVVLKTIYCQKGKTTKKVTAAKPKCPVGYKQIKGK